VRLLRRAGERLTGGELAWTDAGDAGLWLTEPRGPGEVELVATTAPELTARLRAL
jgi:hypothetical protein